jgi:uncharacterized protein
MPTQSSCAFVRRCTRFMATRFSALCYSVRARDDARPDSDYDIAVFLSEPDSFGDEAARLAAIETDILCDTGVVIHALPFHTGADRERTGLMSELRRDGVDL